MAFDRNPMLTIYADKVKVRDFVSERIGSKYLNALYGNFSNINELERNQFPRNFVCKATHGSGAVVICWEGAPRGQEIPDTTNAIDWNRYFIHPDDLVWGDLVKLTEKWMQQNYSWLFVNLPEWAYKDVEPRILFEEVLIFSENNPEDYRFYMVNGVCKFITVDFSKFSNNMRDLYSPELEKLDAYRYGVPKTDFVIPKPEFLLEMLRIANELSKDTDFLRVDLYGSAQGIKFGELTNYPGAGKGYIRPRQFSRSIAKDWKAIY